MPDSTATRPQPSAMAPPTATSPFRVHIVGSTPVDVDATTPQAAAEIIRKRDPAALISKIKRVKEKADA